MIFLYIEDRNLLTQTISYLDYNDLKYTTTDIENSKYAIVGQFNKKTKEIIDKIKTIMILYLEENKIYEKFNTKNKIFDRYQKNKIELLNKCYMVITSTEYFKKILSPLLSCNIEVIHREILEINFKKNELKNKKYIVANDFYYKNIDYIYDLALKFNYNIYYIGYNKLTTKRKEIYDNLPTNVKKIKYIDYISYLNLVKNSLLVIDLNENNFDIKYIQIPMQLKKNILIKNEPYYEDYFIPSKEVYFFDSKKELIVKINKLLENRLSSLTDYAYNKINRDNYKEIANKYRLILK